MNSKPASMTVLGILNICFAGLGLLGGLCGLAMPFAPIPGKEMYEAVYEDTTFVAVTLTLVAVGMLSKTAMLASGIGLVKGKAWGRTVGMGWAGFSIVYGLIVLAVTVTYTNPAMYAAIDAWAPQQTGQKAAMAQQEQAMRGVMGALGIVQVLATALVYQLIFLFMMNRQPVRDYLAAGGADGAGVGADAAGPGDAYNPYA